MQALIKQIRKVVQHANETDEERAERLTQAAEQAGADPETLYAVEQDVRGFARLVTEAEAEKVAEAESKLKAFAPMLGLNPGVADELGADTAVTLVGRYVSEEPEKMAKLIKTLHESFERRGLYAELGTETPSEGELEPEVVAEGGEQA